MRRRQYLIAACGASVAATAGCIGDDDDDNGALGGDDPENGVFGDDDDTDEVVPDVVFSEDVGDGEMSLEVTSSDGEGDASDFFLSFDFEDNGNDIDVMGQTGIEPGDTVDLDEFDGFDGSINAGDFASGDLEEDELDSDVEVEIIFGGDTEQIFNSFTIPEDAFEE